ncbi:MAG: hypothetical protein E3J25_12845 [Anaerolineales bacterium]|nr:MAG: hypothetical protein E3J25_12845 [Anaerolineales bacterium]
MPIVCGVKFRGSGKVYYFSPGDIEDLTVNDHVVVETVRGKELGQVAMPRRQVGDGEIVGELKPILRHATTADLLDSWRFRRQEAEAVAECGEQIARLSLPMRIVSAEYNYDGSRLTFFFTSDQRVDFRDLVRALARVFKTRIELRQIGVRDEAKIVGGLGKCGRPVCCATWLTGFCPVSIRMAKQQDLPLSPMEISGLCGRLLCCLGYENDYYREVKERLPKVGRTITTPYGTGKVIRVSVVAESVTVLLEDGSTVEVTEEQLAARAQSVPEERPRGQDAKARSLANRGSSSPSAKSSARPSGASGLGHTSSEQSASRRSKRKQRRQGRESSPRQSSPRGRPTKTRERRSQEQGTRGSERPEST